MTVLEKKGRNKIVSYAPPPPPATCLGQNVGLVGREVGSFPDTDLLSSNKTESYTLEIISKRDKQSIKLLRVCQHFLE